MYKRNPKQFFAVRSKLKRSGKWLDDNREQGDLQREVRRTDRARERKLRQREPTEGDKKGIQYEDPTGKTLMSQDEQYSSSESVCSVNSSDASELRCEEVFESFESTLSPKVQCSSTSIETGSNCENSVHDKAGDAVQCAREIERAHKSRKDFTGQYRGGVSRVPCLQDGVRSGVEILAIPPYEEIMKPCNVYDFHCFNEIDEAQATEFEAYYQTYNSLGVVIRTLPGNVITTVDILLKIKPKLKEPFILIAEFSKEHVWHWHMIWFTHARSDNAKRTLEKHLDDLPVSICCQKTKSFKHLLRYILKDVRTVTVQNDINLWKLVTFKMCEDVTYTVGDKFGNELVSDLIKVMREYKKYTMEELVNVAPEVMQKYLHRPNIDSIIQNCRVFLLRPTDVSLIFERLYEPDNKEYTRFFNIFAYLCFQNINPVDFLIQFGRVLFRVPDKRNCFVIAGPSNTGKSTFIRPLLNIFNWGEIQSSGQFMFQNCINKELLIWEEPLIGHDFVEGCKRVFEGMNTQVSVKYKPPQTLYRTPILITTNKDLWHYTTSDEMAIRNRIFLFEFTRTAAEYEPWIREHYSECRRKYRIFVRQCCCAITGNCPDCPSSPEPSSESSASDNSTDCTDHNELHYDCFLGEKQRIRTSGYYRHSYFFIYCIYFMFIVLTCSLASYNNYRKTFGSRQRNT